MKNILFYLMIVWLSVSCSDNASSGNIDGNHILNGKYSIGMKVRTANISGDKEDEGFSEVSNIEMWMEFFDNGKLLNSTSVKGKITENEGVWNMKEDSLVFKTTNGLQYTYEVTASDSGLVILKNKDYELSLKPTK